MSQEQSDVQRKDVHLTHHNMNIREEIEQIEFNHQDDWSTSQSRINDLLKLIDTIVEEVVGEKEGQEFVETQNIGTVKVDVYSGDLRSIIERENLRAEQRERYKKMKK